MLTKIHWIERTGPGRLGTSPRPRGNDWLEDEVQAWRAQGVDAVVSLLNLEEERELQLTSEGLLVAESEMKFYSLPLQDRGLPQSRVEFDATVTKVVETLREAGSVLVHCRQGIGRASIIAACVLIYEGYEPQRALCNVEESRGRPVPDTAEQREWILAFDIR